MNFPGTMIVLLLSMGSTLADLKKQDEVAMPPPPRSISYGPPMTESTTPQTPNSTTTSSTTLKPTTPKTTTSSSTTPSTTTSATTPPSTTSSTTPPSTTSSTTPPSTTSSTPKPTTPTTASPTTAKPTPKPNPGKPEVNKFIGNYTGSTNICLMIQTAIQVEIITNKNTTVVMNVPKQPQNKIICPSNDFESLTVIWEANDITFNFLKNKTSYEIQNIAASIVLPGDNSTTLLWHANPEFSVSIKESYLCVKEQAFNLTDKSNATVARLHLSNLQYQAFMNTTEAKYSAVWDCNGAHTSDVVPVVVGCVLAVMVVLILVAYLFGRRRCQARGYLSM